MAESKGTCKGAGKQSKRAWGVMEVAMLDAGGAPSRRQTADHVALHSGHLYAVALYLAATHTTPSRTVPWHIGARYVHRMALLFCFASGMRHKSLHRLKKP